MQAFFGLGIIMALVAMATHQIRAGLLLLAGSVAGSALCALAFLSGVLAILGSLLSAASRPGSQQPTVFETEPPRFVLPAVPAWFQAPTPVPSSRGNRTVATNPLRLEDIRLMLRTGLRDAEIIAAIADRQLVEPMGSAEAAQLRSLGAGNALVSQLQGRPLSIDPGVPAPGRVPVASVQPPAPPLLSVPPPAFGAATPVDYAARDRRIESLKQQINALDEQVRSIRSNPRDNRYWWHYVGSTYGSVNQSALQQYLDQLDQQRNVLRREKWRLEGR